jgi:hypothetical protein
MQQREHGKELNILSMDANVLQKKYGMNCYGLKWCSSTEKGLIAQH